MNPATARNVAINALKASCHDCLVHASLAREDVVFGRHDDAEANMDTSRYYYWQAQVLEVKLFEMGLGSHAAEQLADTRRIRESIVSEMEQYRRNQGEEAANV